MASNPVLTYRNGYFEVPEELRLAWHLHEGSTVRVVSAAGGRVLLDTTNMPDITVPDWRNLQGFLKGAPFDLNADLEADRVRENELDAREF